MPLQALGHEHEYVWLVGERRPSVCVDCGHRLPQSALSAVYAWLRRVGRTAKGSGMARKGRSKQKKYGGGKFKSERQRRFMWAVYPHAAKKWAHNRSTRKTDWRANPKARVKPHKPRRR